MPSEDRNIDSLKRWQEAHEHVAELCRDHPDLPELERCAESMKARLLTGTVSFQPADGATVDHTGGDASVSAHSPTAASGVSAIPGYEIIETLGRGGMGVVYKARHLKLGRVVALKMIRAGSAADERDLLRFRIEAETIARMQHPNIVQVFEVGEQGGMPFLSLEFCEGGSLSRRLKEAPPAPREAAELVETLARAMHAAHQRLVIHRDLKPANILLSGAVPKITDFGLAKKLDEQAGQTEAGAVMGTPSYMAPEQARGQTQDLGPAVDVYALGAILYECLTGQPPFQGNTTMATLLRVMHEAPPAPRQLQPRAPRDLETICLKCLRKEPGKRYGSAQELADDLRRWLDHKPIQARRVGSLERAWLWCQRRPAVAGLLAAFAVALAVGSFLYFQARARLQASALVERLLDAETQQAPGIVAEMEGYRSWTDPLLRDKYQKARPNSRQQLHASLALLGADAGQVPYLYARLLDAEPHEVTVIRDALAPHKDQLRDRLWAVVETPDKGKEAQRLRAASALAKYDPESQRWAKVQEAVGNDLVNVPAAYLAAWMDALRPVREKLIAPLSDAYRNASRRDVERSLATDILADYAADQAHVLADLLLDADAPQFAVLYPKLTAHGDRSVSGLLAEIAKQVVVVKDKKIFESKGTIAEDDGKVKVSQGSALPCKRFEVPLRGEKTYRLTMDSQDLDSFLVLQDKTGKELGFDDDGGGNHNSLLVYTPSRDDTYTVFAASFEGTGSFVLKIMETMAGDGGKEKLAKRQANAAVALLRMNQPEKVWPLLRHSTDPRVRSYLIHRLSPLGADVGAIVKRLDAETDITIRRALTLSLGEYGAKEFSPDDRKGLLAQFQKLYRTATDPGLHASAEWLLRTWKQEAWLKQVNEEWATDKAQREKRLEGIKQSIAKDKEKTPPQWYVNGQGQTMVVIPGPVTFMMGSPPREAGRLENEHPHKRRIGRTFAVAAKAVTVEQARQFDKGYSLPAKFARTADLPAVGINWFGAAAYCNWLSKEEGIDKNQWCYEIKGQVTKLKENYLSLTGYRLPTEAEMEYATRAGALTSRHYGETDELLPKYAWYQKNSQDQTWPVGSLKPNDLGLFDMQGNVYTWCQESYQDYPTGKGAEAAEDQEDALVVNRTDERVLRGASFAHVERFARSAGRYVVAPSFRDTIFGFRPARTLALGSN